ncbi:MAG: hypothetical protein ACXWNB_08865 [Candidatus Binataceae bacterium]
MARTDASFAPAAPSVLPPTFVAEIGDVRGIVTRAVSSARAQGRDYVGQCHAAAQAVMAVRPDLNSRQAFDVVTRLRDSARS